MLKELDELARRQNCSRSALFAQATQRLLDEQFVALVNSFVDAETDVDREEQTSWLKYGRNRLAAETQPC